MKRGRHRFGVLRVRPCQNSAMFKDGPLKPAADQETKPAMAQFSRGKLRLPILPLILPCLVLAAVMAGDARSAVPFSHRLFDRVLQAYVGRDGRVDYTGLKANRDSLDAYIDSLGSFSPRSHPDRFPARQHELAYWINAYNAFVLRGVIDEYPVATVMEIGEESGFFSKLYFQAGGDSLTLDELEHGIIRPLYREPRIHFAVNCAAASCPPLENRAFRGEDLDLRLEAALQRFAGAPLHVRVDAENRLLHLSKILLWFGPDFVEWFPRDREDPPADPTLIDYLMPYLNPEQAAYLRQNPDVAISFNEYDWTLNDQLTP